MSNNWVIDEYMINDYNQACRDSISNEESFKIFKQDPRYNNILEHVSYEESLLYISDIKSKGLIDDSILNSAKENDKYGSPVTFEYDEFGVISPTTIRYIKNSLDIVSHFGKDAKYDNVVEIGGGYGGLCKVFSSFVDFEKYTLIDLPEPSKLSQKYLNNFEDIKNKINYIDTDHVVPIQNIDLLISNYAFSECSTEYQNLYYENVIKNSDQFYIIYNNFQNNMYIGEFMHLISNDFSVYTEYETRVGYINHILYGTKK